MTSGTLILGVLNGLIIALLAVGFVLVYKSGRFLNLAHAQLGAVSALVLAKLVNYEGVNFWLGLVLCVGIGVAVGVAVERFLIRPVRRMTKAPVRLLMLTIGVSQVLLAVSYLPGLATTNPKPFPEPFHAAVNVGGVVLDGMSILTLILAPTLMIGLAYFFGYTSFGKQIRAAASNPDQARLCGISVDQVATVTWGLAGGLSAMSAILNGPSTVTFNAAAVGPDLLLFTMGAAAFGAFVSIPIAVVGGVGLGVVNQVVLAETSNAGDALLAVFGVILVVILLRGKAIGQVFALAGSAVPERPRVTVPEVLRDLPEIRYATRFLAGFSLLFALAFPRLPYFRSDAHRFLLVLVLIYALVGVALTMLVGWAGQVSLGQFAIVGLTAFMTARWAGNGWSMLAMIVVAGAIGAVVTGVIGIPALRVPGLTLAVATLGFAVVAPQWLYLRHWVGGASPFTTPVQTPSIAAGLGQAGSPIKVYYLALVLLVITIAAATALRRSALGRGILSVRDNERASAAFGIAPAAVKVSVLGLSGFIAGTAGVFWAIAWQRVSPLQFDAGTSTAVLAIPIIGGLGSLSGSVSAAALLYIPTFFIAPHLSRFFGSFGENLGFLLFISGIGVVLSMRQFPNGIAGQVSVAWQRYLDRKAARTSASLEAITTTQAGAPEPLHGLAVGQVAATSLDFGKSGAFDSAEVVSATATADARFALSVSGIRVHFGGIAALNGAELAVAPGEIVGLIGPNGAGKTTLMNVVSGVIAARQGSVELFGTDITRLSPAARAARGLARSFQDASLFSGLTVRETVQVALAKHVKTGAFATLVAAPWVRAAEQDSSERAEEILAAFGLLPWADALTAELSTGTRRICDLAAQVAARPRVLLLDEPTAGVAQREAEAFGPLVRRIRDDLDCSIVIIEHDMPLLMGLCDRVYAMEAGAVVAEGTPAEIRSNPRVIASYLGTEQSAIHRSGADAESASVESARRPATRK